MVIYVHYANIHSKMDKISPDLDVIGTSAMQNVLIITRILTWAETSNTSVQ